MKHLLLLSLTFFIFSILLPFSTSQSCTSYSFTEASSVYSSCLDLPVLSSFLHWNHNPSSGETRIAYRHTHVTPSTWVSWAVNPTSKGMVGAQALVAFQKSDGKMRYYTTAVKAYATQMEEADLSFDVSDLSATLKNGEITIFATLKLPNGTTTVNQVWQDGPLVDDAPKRHSLSGLNLQSMGTLNLLSMESGSVAPKQQSDDKPKIVHGILNTVSWGVILPVGVLIARYMKVFEGSDPLWFYLHAGGQTLGYIIGVSGWVTGIRMGGGFSSSGVVYVAHRNIGFAVVIFATLQVMALLLRPGKDHKYRFWWKIYHQTVGNVVLILGSTNILKGLEILSPPKGWRNAYVVFVVFLMVGSLCLELFTCWVLSKRRKKEKIEEQKLGNSSSKSSSSE